MQIIIEPAVTEKLEQLVITLVKEEYFAKEEAAIKYVQAIYRFIYNLPSHTPNYESETQRSVLCHVQG